MPKNHFYIMKKFLQVYQIYFDETQRQKLIYKPYFNEECSLFFEHSIMCKLIEEKCHLESTYFGVVSHSLKEKIGDFKRFSPRIKIANLSTSQFTKDSFELELSRNLPDVMSFQRHASHDPVSLANNYHPNFSDFFKEIMEKIGYKWHPITFENVFYCNYFVCKSEIYELFINEMLRPAMDMMNNMPQLLANSNYPKQLPDHLKKNWGLNHYPYHAFLCERMFSYFVHLNKYTCLHY